MRLKHFDSPQDVVAYIAAEMVATLEDDLARMENEERHHYTAADRREMRNRLADVRMVSEHLTVEN